MNKQFTFILLIMTVSIFFLPFFSFFFIFHFNGQQVLYIVDDKNCMQQIGKSTSIINTAQRFTKTFCKVGKVVVVFFVCVLWIFVTFSQINSFWSHLEEKKKTNKQNRMKFTNTENVWALEYHSPMRIKR